MQQAGRLTERQFSYSHRGSGGLNRTQGPRAKGRKDRGELRRVMNL